MEAQARSVSKQNITVVDLDKVIKQKIKFVSIALDGKAIRFPVHHSINVYEAYHESFKETNDYRTAFCAMAYQMVEDDKEFVSNKEDFSGLTVEDIKAISDEDLKKIGETLLQEADTFKKHYHEDTESDFFRNFMARLSVKRKNPRKRLRKRMESFIKFHATGK